MADATDPRQNSTRTWSQTRIVVVVVGILIVFGAIVIGRVLMTGAGTEDPPQIDLTPEPEP